MASIYYNLTNSAQYSATTGLTQEEFEALLSVFSRHYIPKKDNPISKRKAVLTCPGEALFFILYYKKTYPTFQALGLCFEFSNKTAYHYLRYIEPFLKACLAEEEALVRREFKDQSDFEQSLQGTPCILIDGTECMTQRAEDEQVQEK
jgi:hypothetical protein